jgi:glycerol-3-phosphate acyltransferase PlsY
VQLAVISYIFGAIQVISFLNSPSMEILIITIFGILAYLIGSLPTSVWWGEAYFGIDVRDYGSGNAGATNTFRVLGKRAGIVVMLVDVFKGWTATSMATLLYYTDAVSDERLVFFKLAFGVLGSIIAALAFPLLMLIPVFSPEKPILIIFGFVIFAIVVLTHQKNIVRLINGEESRTVLIRLKKR